MSAYRNIPGSPPGRNPHEGLKNCHLISPGGSLPPFEAVPGDKNGYSVTASGTEWARRHRPEIRSSIPKLADGACGVWAMKR